MQFLSSLIPCASAWRAPQLAAALTACLLPAMLPAFAQDSADTDGAPLETIPVARDNPQPRGETPADVATLEDVVVTAGRVEETLADTPISVTVTSDAELRDTNITDVEVLSDRLPNAQLALTPTNTFLFVRGLGSGGVRSAEQSVGFFVDNVFLGRPQVALFDFLDVEQVELLRGPQGAILGKNTVAGAVNVKTAEPTWASEGYIEVLGGTDDMLRGRGAWSGPLTDTLAARVAYSETDESGYLKNTTQQRLDVARPGRGGRAKLAWEPASNMLFGVSVQAARITQTGDTFELSQASDQVLQLYRQFDPETSTDITDNRTHTDHDASGAVIEGEDVIVSAEWEPALGLLRFTGSTSRQETVADFDLDISPAPFLTFPSVEGYEQSSAELRFDTGYGWGDVSAGVYYFRSDLDLQVDIRAFEDGGQAFLAGLAGVEPGSPAAGALDLIDTGLGLANGLGLAGLAALGSGQSRHRLLQRQTTYSAFGSAKAYLGDRFTLRLDGRFTRETKTGDQGIVFSGATGPLIGAALGEEEYQLNAERSENDFSPRLSLLADINQVFSSYLTVARGFKSGGFNNLAAVPERAEFEEERSLTYEAGLRAETLFGLRGSLALFRTNFDNLQVAALDGTEFFVGNAAQARTQGVELSAEWLFAGQFFAAADLGYLDARYDDYRNAPSRADQDEDSQDLTGRVLQRAPRYSGSVQLGVRSLIPWLNLPFSSGVVAEGASHQFLNIDLDPIDSQPGYVRYNAFAGLSDLGQSYSVRLVARNLTDKTVRREAADVALVGAHSVGVFPPRSVAVEVGYRF